MLFAAPALPLPAQPAQVSNGNIAGQVTDQTKAGIPSVAVSLIHQGTGASRSTATDSTGHYLFPFNAAGVYQLRVSAQGFKSNMVSGLEVQVAQQATENIQLEVGRVIGQREVVALPLNGRNFLDLAKLVPGVAELPIPSLTPFASMVDNCFR